MGENYVRRRRLLIDTRTRDEDEDEEVSEEEVNGALKKMV